MLFSILIAVMVVLGVLLTVLILLQQGQGADAGAAFGSGASGTVFGARGSGGFLSRLTGVLMALFMVLAVFMAWLGRHGAVHSNSVMSGAASAGTSHAAVSAPAPVSAAAKGTMSLPAASATKTPAPKPGSAGLK